MGLFEFSHSLGYPHPDLMLDQMTSTQYVELLMYFKRKSAAREQGEAEAQEATIMQHMARLAARQEKK